MALGGMAAAAVVATAVALWPDTLSDVGADRAPTMMARRTLDPRLELAPTTGARVPPDATGSRESETPGVLGGSGSIADARPGAEFDRRDRLDGDRDLAAEGDGTARPVEEPDAFRLPVAPVENMSDGTSMDSEVPDKPSAGEATRPSVHPSGGVALAPDDRSIAPGGRQPRRELATEPASEELVVRSILYSRNRRLAIIGRQVVAVGDVVDRAVVEEITPSEVVLRLPSGQERRLTLHYGSRDELR